MCSNFALATNPGAYVSGGSSYSPSTDVAACLGYGTFVSLKQSADQFDAGTVMPSGGGNAVAAVSGVGTPSPAINLGSTTANSRSGCVWYPTALPVGSSLRLYFTYRIDSALTGSSRRGYALALADAATNSPYRSDPLMCGASSSSRLGYAGAPVSGTAKVGARTVAISAASWSSSSGRATITTATNHGFSIGDSVTVSGAYPNGYNGTFTISFSGFSTTQFRYTVADPGPAVAGIAPPKIGVEFDMFRDSSRNDPPSSCSLNSNCQHFAFVYWGTAADNDPAPWGTARDGGDDNTHNAGTTGDGSQPLNPRSLSTASAVATPVANIAAARWSGGAATITTAAPHGFASGQDIVVSDVTALGYKGTYTATVTDATHFTYPLASDPGPYPFVATVSAAAWSAGTATITTSAEHGLASGQSIVLANISPAAWNGTYTVTASDATHFSFALAANPGSYVSGGQVSYPLGRVNAASWSGGIVTMATASAHNLVSNQYVAISGVSPSGYNGTYRASVIDATHFAYALTNPAINPGAYVSGGLVAIAGTTSTTMAAAATSSTLAAATWLAGTTTMTTSASHGFATGQLINIAGVSPAGYNGAYAISIIDDTHFSYALATDPGGSFSASTFANPGIATVKSSDPFLPYGTMPVDTDIHVRIDVNRNYDAARHQATLTLRAYMGDTFALAGNCQLSDFQNFSRDLSVLCPIRTPTIEQDGIVVNDVAGPALANVYLGFTTARGSSSGDNQGIAISNLLLRSQ